MKSLATIVLIALSCLFSSQLCAQDISEVAVKEFLVKFDKAISSKNATEIGSYTSENAEFLLTIPMGGQAQPLRISKAQYMAMLRDTWAQASNYTYRRTNEKIVISGGKATVTADVFESLTLQGKKITTQSREIATFESVNGVLLLTRVVANGSM